jgi:hypothetical protein
MSALEGVAKPWDLRVHTPFGDRKSGISADVEIPVN